MFRHDCLILMPRRKVRSHRPAVVTQQRFALGNERFEPVLAVAAAAVAKAGAQLAFEDVKEGAVLLEHLLLAFGLLQAGVFLGVDLGAAVELLAEGADFFFELVGLAAFGSPWFGV